MKMQVWIQLPKQAITQSTAESVRLSQDQIKEILKKYKSIVVVGLSKDLEKDSHRVSAYLKERGYQIIPVNPFADQIFGEKSYKSLLDIPSEIQKNIEIVDIFRPAEDVQPIVEQAIQIKQMFGKPLVVWMQLGIVNERAAEMARQAGLIVVMDKCMMVEHQHLSNNLY